MKRKFVALMLTFILCCGTAVTASADEIGTADSMDLNDPAVEQQTETGGTAADPIAEEGETGAEPSAGNPVAGTDGMLQTVETGEIDGQADTELYAGVLNLVKGHANTEMGNITPLVLSDLTEAQQTTMKPLYEGLEKVEISGSREEVWPKEKAVVDPFLSDVTDMDIDCCGFVFGKMDCYAPLITFIGSPNPDFIVLQLKKDGTWQDINAKWSGYNNEIGFSSFSLEDPVLICFIDVPYGSRGDEITLEYYLKQIYIKKIVYNDLTTSLDSLTTQQQEVVSGIQTKLEESNYSSLNEAEQLSAALRIFSDLLREQTGSVVSKLERWGCLDIVNRGNIDLSGGYPVEFPAPGIAAGDQVVVLHLKADGTWEKIQATAGNGTITGIFTSLSPVYYFKGTFESEASTETEAPAASAASAAHEHSWQTSVIAPTADRWGYTMYGCNECGYSYADHYVAPLGQTGAGRSVSPKTSEDGFPYALLPVLCVCLGGTALVMRRRYM